MAACCHLTLYTQNYWRRRIVIIEMDNHRIADSEVVHDYTSNEYISTIVFFDGEIHQLQFVLWDLSICESFLGPPVECSRKLWDGTSNAQAQAALDWNWPLLKASTASFIRSSFFMMKMMIKRGFWSMWYTRGKPPLPCNRFCGSTRGNRNILGYILLLQYILTLDHK